MCVDIVSSRLVYMFVEVTIIYEMRLAILLRA